MAYPTPGQISTIKKIARTLGITIGDSMPEDLSIWQAIEKLLLMQTTNSKQITEIEATAKKLQSELNSIRASVERLGAVQTQPTKGRFA